MGNGTVLEEKIEILRRKTRVKGKKKFQIVRGILGIFENFKVFL